MRSSIWSASRTRSTRATSSPTDRPPIAADVALLLKLVPLLDRQDPSAAARLLGALDARHAVVTSRPARSAAGGVAWSATYRRRLDELVADAGASARSREASVPNELVFVLTPRWLIRWSPAAARSPFRPSCPMRRGPACAARAARTCGRSGSRASSSTPSTCSAVPGARVVQAAGGIHRFMDWDRPIAQRLGRLPGLEPDPPGSRAAASSATTRSSSASRRPARSGT